MSATTRTVIFAALVTACLAALAGWAGVQYGLRHSETRPQLDELIHHELGLTAEQGRKIEALEVEYVHRRSSLEGEIATANRDLAVAIETDHTYGQKARAALGHFHRAMEQLQELTIRHVLAMRAILSPRQAKKFDATIRAALVENGS